MPPTTPETRRRARAWSGDPKQSAFRAAIGRAPTANTSRRIPPTPVAAPWNGSTALGWLCDSTLNATASPSPTSTAPAFSPGPSNTWGPSIGRRRSSLRECLYAQCSDHISDSIASSTPFGSRSSSSTIRSYSRSVSPSSLWRLSNNSVIDLRPDRLEGAQAVGRAGQWVDRVLGVRHQAEHIALLIAHAGDVILGPIGVLSGRITQQRVHRIGGVIAAGGVLDGHRQPLASRARARE